MRAWKIEMYRADDGWRWRLVAGNGKTVVMSSEAYSSKSNALRAIEQTMAAFIATPEVVILRDDRS